MSRSDAMPAECLANINGSSRNCLPFILASLVFRRGANVSLTEDSIKMHQNHVFKHGITDRVDGLEITSMIRAFA